MKLSFENPEVKIASKFEPNFILHCYYYQEIVKKRNERLKSINERGKNLNMLKMILQNISPTSVALASERAFSNSNDFVTKKRSHISDKPIDNLCFLKGTYIQKFKTSRANSPSKFQNKFL